jgi:hypothetical protein
MPSEPQVGDKVLYVPHEIHAFQPDAAGNLAWVIGRKVPPSGNVEELSGKTLQEYLDLIRRSSDPTRARQDLVLMRPSKPWAAVVTAVNEDGTASLDIASTTGGVTLHYRGIPLDSSARKPHSFYYAPKVTTEPLKGD